MSDVTERLWGLIEPYVAAEGIELDDLEVAGGGKVSILRVTLDGPEAIDVDRIARISRGVSRLLDEEDPFSGAYTLEVSSPGLERKLRRPAHYAKSVGRDAKLKTRREIDGEHIHRGVIIRSGDADVTISTDTGERTIPFDAVTSARTVFVWDKPVRPGVQKH